MAIPLALPYAAFDGAYGDNATGTYSPARAEVAGGYVTLWVGSLAGWAQYFSVPAPEVVVKSAAQRITLVVRGRSYPILADPTVINRVLGYTMLGVAANMLDKPVFGAGLDVGRGLTQVSAANAWRAGGGPAFIDAARYSGVQVSRLGYGPLVAIGDRPAHRRARRRARCTCR